VKWLISDEFLVYYREKTRAELDNYGGKEGSFEAKLAQYRCGEQVSVRSSGGCLVHSAPRSGSTGRYDYASISMACCPCHGEARAWNVPRNALMAAVWEIYSKRDVDVSAWVGALMTESVSHTCHNAPCSDPFHAIKEPMASNAKRKQCLKRGACLGHPNPASTTENPKDPFPNCRMNTKWDSGADWEKVRQECQMEKKKVSGPRFACSAGCKPDGKNSAVWWTDKRHWIGIPCEKGGMLQIYDSNVIGFA